jgi:hypothetical protein
MLGSGAVFADCFNWAAFHGFFALCGFFVALRLFEDEGVAAVIIAGEIVGCGFPAQIAIDALVIDIKRSGFVVFVSVFEFSHN